MQTAKFRQFNIEGVIGGSVAKTPEERGKVGGTKEWVPPDHISVGASVRMISEEGVAQALGGCPIEVARELLDTLGVPRVVYPSSPKKYVNLYALESYLFPLGLPKQFRNGPNNRNGASDDSLIRLHQELAGVIYSTWTRDAVRQRVKKLAREMLNLPDQAPATSGKPLTKVEEVRTYKPINGRGS